MVKNNYKLILGYNWGNITLTWGRYVRYVQLQIQLTTWDSFSVLNYLA